MTNAIRVLELVTFATRMFVDKMSVLLFFNSVSEGEVLTILIFVLMFFGAKSIPGLARTLGRTIRQMKDATQDIQRDIQNSTSDITEDLRKINPIDDIEESVRNQFKD